MSQVTNEPSTSSGVTKLRHSEDVPEGRRSCWVCFATEDEDEQGLSWVQPCNCKGTTKWVHQQCLQRWVDEKQKGNTFSKVSCPQCNTEYIIVFPSMGGLVVLLDMIDTAVYKACPFIAAGLLVGSLYWSAVTYGAVTVMLVFGRQEGIRLMANAQTIMLLVGLPAIPLVLIVGKTVRWEETILLFLRRYTPKIKVLKYILPSFVYEEQLENNNMRSSVPTLNDTVCATKILCGALLLPTIASVIGGIFFESVQSRLQRTLLGGIAYITIKGLFRIYHKQQKYVQKNTRKILDYTPENVKKIRPGAPVPMVEGRGLEIREQDIEDMRDLINMHPRARFRQFLESQLNGAGADPINNDDTSGSEQE